VLSYAYQVLCSMVHSLVGGAHSHAGTNTNICTMVDIA
jgi:hypothetical protein